MQRPDVTSVDGVIHNIIDLEEPQLKQTKGQVLARMLAHGGAHNAMTAAPSLKAQFGKYEHVKQPKVTVTVVDSDSGGQRFKIKLNIACCERCGKVAADMKQCQQCGALHKCNFGLLCKAVSTSPPSGGLAAAHRTIANRSETADLVSLQAVRTLHKRVTADTP
jgi:hypothetical protein